MKLPDGFSAFFPYMIVDRAGAYIDFLRLALGAEEILRVTAEDGRIRNAQVRIGTTMFMIGEASADYPAMPASYYVFVENADASMDLAVRHGATRIMAVSDMPYGDRQGGVRDPAGNLLWISQRLVDGPYAAH